MVGGHWGLLLLYSLSLNPLNGATSFSSVVSSLVAQVWSLVHPVQMINLQSSAGW